MGAILRLGPVTYLGEPPLRSVTISLAVIEPRIDRVAGEIPAGPHGNLAWSDMTLLPGFDDGLRA